ncbi:Cystathionine gamma-synthase [Dispira parvispora]|uniref:cystathionine gamma-synthase n=1 Tax=Dispira parvispora TaxID=1520584 RepID=A0A9W8AS34_9FUNG|nr:Cystathionine gamma-synthase [Dispira parvispora]
MTVQFSDIPEPGLPIPANVNHAVSVSLPHWQDNIDYEEGNPRITQRMVGGYPRFFYHRSVQELCGRIVKSCGVPDQDCLVFPSMSIAQRCRDFICKFYKPTDSTSSQVNEETQSVTIQSVAVAGSSDQYTSTDIRAHPVQLFAVMFPTSAAPTAKLYWQHTGEGVSSRLAEHCLKALQSVSQLSLDSDSSRSGYRHTTGSPRQTHPRYQMKSRASPSKLSPSSATPTEDIEEYLEACYGRNLPVRTAQTCKQVLRQRIAQALNHHPEAAQGPTADDVYLFPTGMTAIFHAHRSLLTSRGEHQSICFGFPYTDTLKILQKFGSGCYFLGQGEGTDYDRLDEILQRHYQDSEKQILALFCECPGNPLLKTPDLPRLRKLADRYGFALVVDETIGNFVNLDTITYADIVVSSLTKVFSGDSNVMGGSLALNPHGPFYATLRQTLDNNYEDSYWCEDAVFMERNSRTFHQRVQQVNHNAEALADLLVNHPLVSKVHYPKYTLRPLYDQLKLPGGGYGGLLSIELTTPDVTRRFYDLLHCAKGPSLGTNFTLVSPYTILAHYHELEWAESYGVSRYLIRCSIGLENRDLLLQAFTTALDQAVESC